ncbi:MAG: hypothetical protein ACREME_11980, partial [Gemmatimonadales bacterium]
GARRGDLDAQLSPFPDSLAGADWADGRSDFDVPHRLLAAAEVRLGGPFAPRLAAVYRYRSGWPFTAGFRPGVDANGDGSMRNDPAYVDDQVPGVLELTERWDCLRTQIGRFAERNSCREPGVHALDLRFALRLVRVGRADAELVVDALNAVESSNGIRDQALYLVDRTGAVTVDPASGGVTVPLRANSSFGRLLTPATVGRSLRIGVRIH